MDKKYDHLYHEKATQEYWEHYNIYTQENNPGPHYTIDTPPPTVSGALHIGHIFSYTQTDIIARYKRMSGFSVFYPFGFDDNGLPTERFVEKKNSVTAHALGRSAFIKLCLQETHDIEQAFKALWQKMGLSIDWSLVYSTIDDTTRTISQASFIELYHKGHIYRKNEPALYCTACRTSVAQAELDDLEKQAHFNDIVFTTAESGEPITIGTTRPELLPTCVAVFYNPHDTRYQHLYQQQAVVPLFNTVVPILADELVNPEKGTGLVMCCAFGDKTDIEWIKKYNLTYKTALGFDGIFLPWTGPLAGLKVHEARTTVLKLLKNAERVRHQQPIVHAVQVHERCKKEIEYLPLPQWFLKILPYKKDFMVLAEEIAWYPHFMKARYSNWVENIKWDWCLSRQRFYGIPFPAWHCTICNEIILADLQQLPIDPQEVSFTGTCPNCKGSHIVPDTDVMDTWNTSSLTPYICLALYNKQATVPALFTHSSGFIPMSMRPQAHDIIRTWAFYTIVKTWLHERKIPWKEIIISGHVLSTEKEKISKSQGNSPLAPENLLKTYPADAVRYWTASGSLGHDVAFSETQLAIGQKLLIKLWNAFKFAEQYLTTFDPKHLRVHHLSLVEQFANILPSATQEALIEDHATKQVTLKLDIVDQWMLHLTHTCYTSYQQYFVTHEFSLALDILEKFFWGDYCDNYLELIKDKLTHQDQFTQEQVISTLWTLYTVGIRILQLYAPFIPHITEAIYQQLYKNHENTASLHQTKFSTIQQEHVYTEAVRIMKRILAIITQVRRLKTEQQLSLKTELALLVLQGPSPVLDDIQQATRLLQGVTKAQQIIYEPVLHGTTNLIQHAGAYTAYIAVSV